MPLAETSAEGGLFKAATDKGRELLAAGDHDGGFCIEHRRNDVAEVTSVGTE